MDKTTTLKNKISEEIKCIDFLNPDYVYFPFTNEDKVLVRVGKKILKGEEIIDANGCKVYSTISGKILGTTDSLSLNNESVKCLVIENDFKETTLEKRGAVKYINDYSKKELLSLIDKYSSFSSEDFKNIKNLVINGIDRDPYEKTYAYIIDNFAIKLLEVIDALISILSIDNTILVINNHNNTNVINLTNHIGTYPNIKLRLSSGTYPNGFEQLVIQNHLSKKQISEGYLYLTIEDIYNLYLILKRKKPIFEKFITVAGNSLEEEFVANVKIGSNIANIISETTSTTNDKYFVIKNGLIAGMTLNNLDEVLLENTRSIFLNTKDEAKTRGCINCGLCNAKCPVNLNPKYLLEHKKADRSKCIGCGLCTYICPSKINFKPYLGGNDE